MKSDNLEKINYMLLGPVRHRYTALERAEAQGIEHLVIPRYTRVVGAFSNKEINRAYNHICNNEMRNKQILDDIQNCVKNGRTPEVLTRFKEQARYLYEQSQNYADYVFVFYGDNTNKENDMIEAEKEIVISSPKLRKDKVDRFIRIVKSRQEAGVNITVITEEPENNLYENTLVTYLLIDEVRNVGINVKTVKNNEEHYAVIDGLLVWHGGMNLLGKEDAWDNLIRVKDSKAASELLIMAYEVTKEV